MKFTLKDLLYLFTAEKNSLKHSLRFSFSWGKGGGRIGASQSFAYDHALLITANIE